MKIERTQKTETSTTQQKGYEPKIDPRKKRAAELEKIISEKEGEQRDEKPEQTENPQQEVKLTRGQEKVKSTSELPAEQLKLKESYTAALEDMETKFLKPGFDKLKFLLEKRNLPVSRETIAPYLESIESTISQRLQTFCEIKEKQGIKLDYFPLVPAAMETLMGWVKDEEIVIKDKEILTLQEEKHRSENLREEIEEADEVVSRAIKTEEKLQQELNAVRAELAGLKEKAATPTSLIEEQKLSIREKTKLELKSLLASNEVLQRVYLIKDRFEAILSLLNQEKVNREKDGPIDISKFDSLCKNLNSFIDLIEEQHKNRITLLAEAEEKCMSEESREYLVGLIKQEREFSGAKKYEEDQLDGLENQGIIAFIYVLDDDLANHPEIFETVNKEEIKSLIQDLIKTSELEEIEIKPGDRYNAAFHEPVRWEQDSGKPQDEIIKILRRGFIKNKKVLRRARIIVAQ